MAGFVQLFSCHDAGNNAPSYSSSPMKIAQYALPHDTSYKLLSSFHTGGIEHGVPCQNCGKLLSHVAVVANEAGESFRVGMDCAATLSTVNPFEFDKATDAFNTGKAVRSKLLAERKKYAGEGVVTAEACYDGTGIFVEAYRMRWLGGQRYRDLTYRRFVELNAYVSVVKPLCGELLPEHYRTIAEQLAEREKRIAERLAGEGIGRLPGVAV